MFMLDLLRLIIHAKCARVCVCAVTHTPLHMHVNEMYVSTRCGMEDGGYGVSLGWLERRGMGWGGMGRPVSADVSLSMHPVICL